MSIGPVEYLVIGFPGNRFSGRIVPALAQLVESGTVRILDLVFIVKGTDGTIDAVEYDALEGDAAAFADLEGEAGGLLNEEDIEAAADTIEPGSSAALLVWEDLWATDLAEALRAADATLVTGGRVPHEIVVAAREHIEAAG